jgi:hypothetical protein
MDLNIVIVAVFTLNWADPRVLEGYVARGNPSELQVPVDQFGRLVFCRSQQLIDLRQDTSSGER